MHGFSVILYMGKVVLFNHWINVLERIVLFSLASKNKSLSKTVLCIYTKISDGKARGIY